MPRSKPKADTQFRAESYTFCRDILSSLRAPRRYGAKSFQRGFMLNHAVRAFTSTDSFYLLFENHRYFDACSLARIVLERLILVTAAADTLEFAGKRVSSEIKSEVDRTEQFLKSAKKSTKRNPNLTSLRTSLRKMVAKGHSPVDKYNNLFWVAEQVKMEAHYRSAYWIFSGYTHARSLLTDSDARQFIDLACYVAVSGPIWMTLLTDYVYKVANYSEEEREALRRSE